MFSPQPMESAMLVAANRRSGRRWAVLGRVVALVLASATLSGCVVVPYEPFPRYHHWY